MDVDTVTMAQHVCAPTTPATQRRLVLSRLPHGVSPIGSRAPSLKILLEGEEFYRIDGRVYRLLPGRMLFVDRGEPLEATIRRGARSRGLCVYFPAADAGERSGEALFDEQRVALRALEASEPGRQLLGAATAAHRAGDRWSESAATIMRLADAVLEGSRKEARQQIARLMVKRSATRTEVLNRLEAARAHLHERADRPVTLGELADIAGMSGFHLSRYFTAVYGKPPIAYHRSVRLQRAADLLAGGGRTVSDVAELVGYSDLSAFSHAFARERGCAPSTLSPG